MNIVLTRVDSRLIHGQVMTKWVKQKQVNKIIIISNELAEDEFMRAVYLMSAPEGVAIECVTEEDFLVYDSNGMDSNTRVLVLVPSLQVIERVVKGGFKFKEIQIGGLGGAPDRKVVFKNITLDDADVGVIKYLNEEGIDVEFQIIPEDAGVKAIDIIKNF